MGPLYRTRAYAVAARTVTGALEAELLTGPGQFHGLEVFVHGVVAALEIGAEGEVLTFQIARAEAQCQTPRGKHVEGGCRARDDERVAVWQYQDAGLQSQGAGVGRYQAQHHERVLGIVTAGVEPASGRAGVIGDVAAAEAGLFDGATDVRDGLHGKELVGREGVVKR